MAHNCVIIAAGISPLSSKRTKVVKRTIGFQIFSDLRRMVETYPAAEVDHLQWVNQGAWDRLLAHYQQVIKSYR